jgi:hypothetical protein
VQWREPTVLPASQITGYLLEMDDGNGGQFAQIYDGSTQNNNLFHQVSGLVTGLQYSFRVRAVNFNGVSEPSDVQSFFVCVEPRNFEAPRLEAQSNEQISISWQAPSNNGGCRVTSYAVFRDDGLGSDISVEVNSESDPAVRNNPSINSLTISSFPAGS